jgi:tRNA/tmRNA/rRNA uracil-C5-methylase (TrmA/RlmC/RlmD family)
MSQEDERNWKISEIRQILEKYAPSIKKDISIDWIDCGFRKGHRIRGVFRLQCTPDRLLIGLQSTARDGTLVDIRDCPAQSPGFTRLMTAFASLFESHLEEASSIESLEIRLSDESPNAGGLAHIKTTASLSAPLKEQLVELARSLNVSLSCQDSEGLDTWLGRPSHPLTHRADPHILPVEVPLESWYHATPRPADLAHTWLMKRLERSSTSFALELGAGVGTLTHHLLRKGFEVLAIDRDYRALSALQHAADKQGLNITTRAGNFSTILKRLNQKNLVSSNKVLAVINPMRKHLGMDCLQWLPRLNVNEVAYLGPAAVSTARDLESLYNLSYRLDQMAVVNLHPATAQITLAAVLHR